MGIEIVEVPEEFEHPRDEAGEFEPGMHLELLWYLPTEEKSCFQIYENISEGTPVSPILESKEAIASWLEKQGNSKEMIQQFISMGHYPSLVISEPYE